jgi:hypothetical protein
MLAKIYHCDISESSAGPQQDNAGAGVIAAQRDDFRYYKRTTIPSLP